MEKLLLPGGSIYGGAPTFSMKGRDGATYVVYCGERPGRKFGTHAFRVLPNGVREWIELPAFTETRAGVTVEADGAYITWPTDRDTAAMRVKLPGFVPMDYTGELPPSIPVQPAPTPAPDHQCVDAEGRAYTNSVKNELKGQLAKVENRVSALERGGAGGGVSEQTVRDIIWSGPTVDRVFAEMKNRDSGVAKEVAAIAREVSSVKPEIDRDELKALVRDVLLELIAG